MVTNVYVKFIGCVLIKP